MHFLWKLWPWVVCFSCHSFSVFPSVLQNIYYCYSQKKKDKKYSEEPECFAWQSLCGIGWVSESHGGLCANKQGLILLGVLEKWNVSVRFFYPCLCWARKRRHKCTCFSGCAALERLGVWLRVQNASCLLPNWEPLASVKRKLLLPREKTLHSFLPHRRANCPRCAQASPRGPKMRTAWKNSRMLAIVPLVSQKIKSIFLHQMRACAFRWLGGRIVPYAETGKLARFPELFFMDTMENLMRKREIRLQGIWFLQDFFFNLL